MVQMDFSNQVDAAEGVFRESLKKIKNHGDCDPIIVNAINSLEDAVEDYSSDVAGLAEKIDERRV